MESENKRLDVQKKEMKATNLWLESKTLQRRKELTASNESIIAYLKVNAEEIEPSLHATINSIDKLGNEAGSTESTRLLRELSGKLNAAFGEVKHKFRKSQLTRKP